MFSLVASSGLLPGGLIRLPHIPFAATPPRAAVFAISFDFETPEEEAEHEEAMERYRAMGLLDAVENGSDENLDDEDEDDDVTTEQMVAWSRAQIEKAAAGAAPRSPALDMTAAAEAGEKKSPVADMDGEKKASSESKAAPREFTVENVDKVLEEVRPYLISDGGNVAVVSVDAETMGVTLALQGACTSCASSTVTMKMGIERVLRENWPNLGAVMQQDPEEAEAAAEAVLTVQTVEDALEPIMPAIYGLGGKISVLSAEGGCVRLQYTGPEKTKLGIELSLKDNPLVEMVVWE